MVNIAHFETPPDEGHHCRSCGRCILRLLGSNVLAKSEIEKSETQEILSLKPTVKAPEQMASQTKTSLPTINFQGQNCWLRFKEGEKKT